MQVREEKNVIDFQWEKALTSTTSDKQNLGRYTFHFGEIIKCYIKPTR